MRLLPCVDQVMFLKVGELSETLFAQVALERPLAAVHPKMDLQLHNKSLKKKGISSAVKSTVTLVNSCDKQEGLKLVP